MGKFLFKKNRFSDPKIWKTPTSQSMGLCDIFSETRRWVEYAHQVSVKKLGEIFRSCQGVLIIKYLGNRSRFLETVYFIQFYIKLALNWVSNLKNSSLFSISGQTWSLSQYGLMDPCLIFRIFSGPTWSPDNEL